VPFPEEVAAGVRRGCPDAVGAVYAALADRLLGYLTARVRDRAAAEDILESTFVELLRNGHTITGGAASIKVWLFRAAHFNALDYMRKVRRRAEDLYEDPYAFDVIDTDRGPAETAVADDVSRRVRRAMQQLSIDQRQVLFLRYLGGLTAPEVAHVLRKSDGAIRSLQHRGERALARLLEDDAQPAAPSTPPGASEVQT
jgi:RNA polymerase sigma-70 factor, ECF subfamily